MPVVTEETVQGWVSCRDPRCGGYEQRETQVTRRTQAFSYRELGGDLPGNERESVEVVWTDEPCPVCAGPQVFADEPRPEYAPISGQDPLALLNLNQQGQIRDVQMRNLESAKEMAELKAMLANQAAQMSQMQAELQRRKGGRPPKDTESE